MVSGSFQCRTDRIMPASQAASHDVPQQRVSLDLLKSENIFRALPKIIIKFLKI